MDLSERCGLLLEQIADRVTPGVLAEARSYGADGEWEAALITIGNTGVEVSDEMTPSNVVYGNDEQEVLARNPPM